MAVKIRLKSPPTYDSTASILPIVLDIVRDLVDLKTSNLIYRVVERDIAFDTNLSM
jgi:hypothetical protein